MPRLSHLRPAGGHSEHHRVSAMELFFDLVFVFAVTQLSHYLLEHHDLAGVLQTLVMFLAVWWAWVYTAWATNWLDPDRAPVRLGLALVMLLGLVLSSAIREAFGISASSSPSPMSRSRSAGPPIPPGPRGSGKRAARRILAGRASISRSPRLCGSPAGSTMTRRGGWPGGRPRSPSNIADRRPSSRCPASAARGRRNGRSAAPTWRSAAPCSSSSRSARAYW